MIIKRSEAITLSAFIEYFNLPEESRLEIIDNALAENGIGDAPPEIANQLARKYMAYEFKSITNDYLSSILSKHFGYSVKVTGIEMKLLRCYCCGYKTLRGRGEYDICRVCWWEDDGGSDPEKYSSVNHMTLQEGKLNFEKNGVVSDYLLEKVDANRTLKYVR